MKNLVHLLVFILCSTSFAESIDIEIWDKGDGSSGRVISKVTAQIDELTTQGTIKTSYPYELAFLAICGAFKICIDLSDDTNPHETLRLFKSITSSAKLIDVCPEHMENWTRK